MACTKDVWHAGTKCYCYILSSTDFPKFLKHKQTSCHLFSISRTISVVNLKSLEADFMRPRVHMQSLLVCLVLEYKFFKSIFYDLFFRFCICYF
jgi:hypothetical protein